MSGLDPAAIFLGKAAAIAAQLIALEVVLAIGVTILYDVSYSGAAILLCSCIFGTLGIAATGTVYGALSTSMRGRETLLPLLFLPIVAPLLLAAARACEAALGTSVDDGWAWIRLLGVFAVIYTAIGTVAFGPLMEDA
jgi:heme exporter protein B